MCYKMAGRSDLVIDFNAPREVAQHELSILTADEASVTANNIVSLVRCQHLKKKIIIILNICMKKLEYNYNSKCIVHVCVSTIEY